MGSSRTTMDVLLTFLLMGTTRVGGHKDWPVWHLQCQTFGE